MRVEGRSAYKIPLFPLKGAVHHRRYVYVYISTCGMLHGRLQRKNSTHIRDVGILHLMLHCG